MSKNKLKVNVRPLGLLNLLAFKKLIPDRKKRIENAPSKAIEKNPPVNELAKKLHPEYQYLIISDIVQETSDVKTYRLISDPESSTKGLALFRPGQYLTVFFELEGACVTRPYSISSSPNDALKGYYELTIKKTDGGFVTNTIWDHWVEGVKVKCSGPQGQFYFDDLRDSVNVVGIAGGSGVTPFRSMAKSILDGTLDINLTLFYGSNTLKEAIFQEEFKQMEKDAKGKFKIINVLCHEQSEHCEYGFITADTIKKYTAPEDSSFFICGPQTMYQFVEKELEAFQLRKKAVRWELFGEIRNIENTPGYPAEKGEKTYQAHVHMGNKTVNVPALSNESLLTALERAGLCPPARCRSGTCGVCRTLLVDGDVFIPEQEDSRRTADRQHGYIYLCCSFPVSDVEIVVPRGRK